MSVSHDHPRFSDPDYRPDRLTAADDYDGPRLESDKGDFAEPCPDCGAPEGAGHYSCCPSLPAE